MFQVTFTRVTDFLRNAESKKMQNVVRLKLPACYMLLMFVYHAADIHGKLKEIHCELSQKKERQKGW